MSKSILTALLVLAIATSAVAAIGFINTNVLNHSDKHFEAFLRRHNKAYLQQPEYELRRSIYNENKKFIEAHNQEAAQGKHSFTLGETQFADMTNEEYRAMLKRGLSRKVNPEAAKYSVPFVPDLTAPVPDSFDWRTKGAVNPVKDQGQCGSCWTFSATAAMETAWFLHSKTLLSLSEQMCVDCVNGGADDCNAGGEMHDCYLQVIKQKGDELESDYPYTATSGGGCRYNPSKAVTNFSRYINVTQGDENALKIATATKGVVSVGIDASSIWFQLYSGGVFNLGSCKKAWDELDHGVAVVGYGHDASQNLDYWIVRNSWAATWGLQGYIWMARNQNNQCGIATDATIPIV